MSLILLDPTLREPPRPRRTAPGAAWLVLAGILVLAAALRLVGVDWDAGQHLHPDERFITMVENAIQLPSSIAEYFDTAKSPLNPYNRGFGSFVYGTVPLYMVKVLGEWTGWNTYEKVTLLGRVLSALFDLGTILLAFLIGRRLFNWRVAALGAFLIAVTPMHIQQSHFFTTDTFVVFFVMAALYYAVRTAQDGGWPNYALMGLFYGIATASKINAATFGLVVFAACALRAYRLMTAGAANGRLATAPRAATLDLNGLSEPLSGFCIALIIAFLAFRVGQPNAFTGPGFFDVQLSPKYTADLESFRRVSIGEVDAPPSVQFANRTKYLYPMEQLVLWGMGLPLGLASFVGIGLALFWLARLGMGRRPDDVYQRLLVILPLIWIAFNLWYWGGNFASAPRYFLPVYPLMILLASWLLVELAGWARRRAPARSDQMAAAEGARVPALAAALQAVRQTWDGPLAARLAVVGIAVVVGGTTLYGLAYATIYTRTTTRVAASEWIYANYPPGTKVTNEHWDDPIPLNLDGHPAAPYAGNGQLELYAEEDPIKRDRLIATLDGTDVIAITSSRLYTSIPRIPERYPLATEYYRLLFSGQLGFTQVATFTSYPRLGPFVVRDDAASELWVNYDHPKVMLFQKTPEYSTAKVRALLDQVPMDQVVKGLKPIEAYTHGLLLSAQERAVEQAGGTWSEIVQRDSLINQFPAVAWWLLAVLLGWAAYPLAWAVFGRLGDRGYGIAKMLGIALLAWGAWLLASLHVLPYSRGSILLVLALMALSSAAVVWRRRAAFVADVRARWELLLFAEVVFAGAYVFFHGIRMANPDLWHGNFGGEKPMDFAYLNAILKSTYFPPYDPWLAGGYINYYYFGQVLVATLIKLTGTVPAVAYNLAVALFFALVVAGAFSFGFNFLVGANGHRIRSPRQIAGLGWAEAGGLLAALFVAVIGNLDGLVQVVEGLGKASNTVVGNSIPGLGGLIGALRGLPLVLSGAAQMPVFDFWRSTRVIGPEDPGPITEFPYFTFLYGDLHAHMLALPLTLLALHIALALVRSGGLAAVWAAVARPNPLTPFPMREGGTGGSLGRLLGSVTGQRGGEEAPAPAEPAPPFLRRDGGMGGLGRLLAAVLSQEVVWLIALGGLVVGLLRATNTWDFPTYLLILVGAGAIAEYRAARAITVAAIVRAAIVAGALYVVASVVIEPYLAHFGLFYTGIEPIKATTSLVHYLTILGFFLFMVTSLLVYEAWLVRRRVLPRLATSPLLEQAGPAQGFWSPPRTTTWRLSWNMVFGYGAIAGLAVAVGFALLGKLVPAVVVILLLFVAGLVPWHRQRGDRLLLLGMIATALALTAAVELVVLKGDVGRMNTVFKFYLQVWVLLGLAAGIGAIRLLRRWRPGAPSWQVWSVVAAVLLAGCIIYPVQATPVKLHLRFDPTVPPTDDGMAYMKTGVYADRGQDIPLVWDYRALTWMQDNVPGSPVVLEANTGLYKWGSRVSIYTGLPTVVGWDWHQRQQRGDFSWMVEERVRDVQLMYETPDWSAVAPLFRKYGVEYVYVGPLERAYYSDAGLRKFHDLTGSVFDLVYADPAPTDGVVDFTKGVQIYRLKPGAAGPSPSALSCP
ncbi:MAG TPA: DUF2298 domain-containing protein, partial [Chloroflexota bacterium]